MPTVTKKDTTRLEALYAEYLEAAELFGNDDPYVDYDSCEKVDKNRGVIKDVCQPCLAGSSEDVDLDMGISIATRYEGHEDMAGATCALCNEDFWGMKGGSLALFEPKFSLERWG